MFIDLHVHESLYSPCSEMTLEEAVGAAQAVGLDAVCITDHGSMAIREKARKISRSRGFPVFVGMEVTSMQGDIVVFGHSAHFHRKTEAQDIVNATLQSGGFCFAAHPFRSLGGGLGKHLFKLKGLQGIEVLNGGNTMEENSEAMRACELLGLVPVGGSDAHARRYVGQYATWFPDAIHNEVDLVTALRAGRCHTAICNADGEYVPMKTGAAPTE